jgi:AraC-like DNA-binding protein
VIFREFRPSPALRPLVERLWWLEGAADEIAAEPIPPDGRTELIVHAGDPFLEADGRGGWRAQARVLLAGQLTRAAAVRPTGSVRVVGARVLPHAMRVLIDVPAGALTDRVVDLAAVDGRLAARLRHGVASRTDGASMVAALDRELVRLAGDASRPPSPVAAAVELALASRGLVRVDELASRAGAGSRTLERAFQDHVGVPPKLFLRIVRFQEVLAALRTPAAGRTWGRIAAEHGFYDQSHFIRDFSRFVGVSPGAWQVGDRSLAALFSALRRGDALEAPPSSRSRR